MNAKAYLQQLIDHGERATLQEILDAKEARAQKQKSLLEQGETLLCFTLNIPGAVKRCELYEQGYREAVELILQQLSWHHCEVLHKEEVSSPAGWELFLLLDADARKVKQLMVQIEEENDFGRLLDIDVLGQDGLKISRRDIGMPPRRCLLCEESAAACARSRRHCYEELHLKTIEILQDHFAGQFVDHVASNAARALLHEVATTPKPGLVDRQNSGSHRDMDFSTFIDSASVLIPYFRDMVKTGIALCELPPEDVLPQLRYAGRKAEDTMNRATHGINCHKGIIFSMGVICAAIGMEYGQGKSYNSEEVLTLAKGICHSLLEDFQQMDKARSSGEQLYAQQGITGIRGEASRGYPTVAQVGLPALKRYLAQGLSLNDAGAWTLLELFTVTEDSNVLHRSSMAVLKKNQEQVKALLAKEKRSRELLEALDEDFIKQNISPGGCADLLALCYFLYFMEAGQ